MKPHHHGRKVARRHSFRQAYGYLRMMRGAEFSEPAQRDETDDASFTAKTDEDGLPFLELQVNGTIPVRIYPCCWDRDGTDAVGWYRRNIGFWCGLLDDEVDLSPASRRLALATHPAALCLYLGLLCAGFYVWRVALFKALGLALLALLVLAILLKAILLATVGLGMLFAASRPAAMAFLKEMRPGQVAAWLKRRRP